MSNSAVDLKTELELRARLQKEFDRLHTSGFAVGRREDLEALAELLNHAIETRKQAEKQEKELKAELRRHFTGQDVLDCGTLIAIIDRRTRKDLNRETLTAALGSDFLAGHTKTTNYETLTLKRKA